MPARPLWEASPGRGRRSPGPSSARAETRRWWSRWRLVRRVSVAGVPALRAASRDGAGAGTAGCAPVSASARVVSVRRCRAGCGVVGRRAGGRTRRVRRRCRRAPCPRVRCRRPRIRCPSGCRSCRCPVVLRSVVPVPVGAGGAASVVPVPVVPVVLRAGRVGAPWCRCAGGAVRRRASRWPRSPGRRAWRPAVRPAGGAALSVPAARGAPWARTEVSGSVLPAGGRRRGQVRVARQRRRQRRDGLEHPLLVDEPGVALLLAHARQRRRDGGQLLLGQVGLPLAEQELGPLQARAERPARPDRLRPLREEDLGDRPCGIARLRGPAAGGGPADTQRGDDDGDRRAAQRVPRREGLAGGTGAPARGADAGEQGDDRGGRRGRSVEAPPGPSPGSPSAPWSAGDARRGRDARCPASPDGARPWDGADRSRTVGGSRSGTALGDVVGLVRLRSIRRPARRPPRPRRPAIPVVGVRTSGWPPRPPDADGLVGGSRGHRPQVRSRSTVAATAGSVGGRVSGRGFGAGARRPCGEHGDERVVVRQGRPRLPGRRR